MFCPLKLVEQVSPDCIRQQPNPIVALEHNHCPVAKLIVGWDPLLLSVSLIACSDQMIVASVDVLAEHVFFCFCGLWIERC